MPSPSFPSGGVPIPVEVFSPAGPPNGAVVVIAHGSDSLNEPWLTLMRKFGAELSQGGFLVLLPSYFAAAPPTAGPAGMTKWQATLSDAVAHGRTLAGGASARVGLLGFSLGGHLCLRLRAQARALVSFFAPELAELGGIGASAATPHAQVHHGLSDPVVPFSQAERIVHLINTEGTATEFYSYPGAGHGFGSPTNAADKTALATSKERTLQFFTRRLG